MKNETINVLLIEDNPGDARLVQEALHETQEMDINLIHADNLVKGLKLISAERLHVVLLDLNLPDCEGMQTFQQVKKFAFDVPIIIMSVLSDKEIIYQALKEGAQDYLIKGALENEILIRGIRYAMWSHYHPA